MVHFRSVIILVLCFMGAVSGAQDYAGDLQKAEKYFELRDFESAQKRFQQIIEDNPEQETALWRLGDIAWLEYDFEEAYTYYGIAAGLSWKSDEHIRRYIEMLILHERFEMAHKWALNLEGKNAEMGSLIVQKLMFAQNHAEDASSYAVERHNLNSEHSDFGANFLADDYLVFSSSRTDIKRVLKEKGQDNWAGSAFNQLFVGPASQAENLDKPLFLQSDLENNYNEGPLGISGDGEWVAVTKNNFLDGYSQVYTPGIEMSLYLGKLDDKGKWRDLKPFEHNFQGYASGMAALNEEGDVMFFSSNRPDGFGGFDIYRTEKTEDGWTYPRNMGPAINTAGNEITPFVTNDELYFSSDLHPGLGGFDIYRAELQDEGHSTKIYHLGTGLNSAYDEYYFIYDTDQDLGFLSSNRNVGYADDLFRIKGLGKRVKLKILDAGTNEGLSGANIDFTDCENQSMTTDREGVVSMRLMQDLQCSLHISKEGYGTIEIPFNTSERQYWELALYPMNSSSESEGQVLDGAGQALSHVYIKATDIESGFYIESITNKDGYYKLDLDPETEYKMEYLKSGFSPESLTVKTNKEQFTELPLVQLKSKEKIADKHHKTKEINSADEKSGYALQLGAFKEIETVNLSNYSDIADLGTLFTVEQNGIYKLRLGVYDNERTAEDILSILKQRGYEGAFKVFQAEEKDALLSLKGKSKNAAYPSGFGVQLGAYTQPKWFDRSKAKELGMLSSVKKDNLTVFYLYDYDNLESAQEVLSKAKKKGFADAYVIKFTEGGEFKKH